LYRSGISVRIVSQVPSKLGRLLIDTLEALHQSYWQTVRRDTDGKITAAAMGRSEDRLVRRNGKWLIQSRKLTVFTD
jgi:hypothetical protein